MPTISFHLQAEQLWSAVDSLYTDEDTPPRAAEKRESERLQRVVIHEHTKPAKQFHTVITPEHISEVTRLRGEGLSFPAIGRALGICQSTAWKIYHRTS